MQQRSALHHRRAALQRDVKLDRRLDLGLGSIPLVSDVLSVVNGLTQTSHTTITQAKQTTTTTTTPTATTTPASTPTGGSGSGNGDGNSDTWSNGDTQQTSNSDSSTATSSGDSGSGPASPHTGVAAVGGNPTAHPSGPTSFEVIGTKTIAIVGTVTYSDGLPTSTDDGQGTSPDSSGSKKGVPTAALAVVGVIGALALLAFFGFLARRRAINKRTHRRTMWLGGVLRGNPEKYGDNSDRATAGDSAATRSIRSSFGTTFDHSEFSITFDDNPPALPPMVEIRGGPALVPKGDPSMPGNGVPLSPISAVTPFAPSIPVGLLVSIDNNNLFSDASRRSSTGSDHSAQYAYDRSGASNPTGELATPLSVRPFSPSEMFAFPAPPPSGASSPTRTSAIPRITQSLVPPQTPLHAFNPFADAFAAARPASLTARASAEFDAIETVWRSFTATLTDEMTVSAGDAVKVHAVYDDGWAMVERVKENAGKGKAKAVLGLIPIDCMRRADESVDAFLAAKRVSSVDATGYTAMAM